MRFASIFATTLVLCFSLIVGCATMQPNLFSVNVDSFAQTDTGLKKRYMLLPGGKEMEAGDLQFQEFAGYIDKTLSEKGFVKVNALQDAEIAIFLAYAIGDPQTYQYSHSLPIWGETGISSANTNGTVSSSGGMATYSEKTTFTPSYGITGYRTKITTETLYTRFLFLDAYDITAYDKEKKMNQIWKISAVSTGESGDLRFVFPYMVAAMKSYVGTNTRRKIEVLIREDDPSVKNLYDDQSQINK